ncbi:MAG: DUF502 domain-containing protein [Deltaproteobacteria bacterium]|nr:DUF502 domain-containing protein [Deltaproteobacteria bacterium]
MKGLGAFIKTTVLGGILIILPAAILVIVFSWIYRFAIGLIHPFTMVLISQSNLPKFTADVVVIFLIVMACFLVGLFVKTKAGGLIYHSFEQRVLKAAPGYSLAKDIVAQLLGKKTSPFSSVVLVRLFGSDTLATGFIMDTHPDGIYSIFLPTAPNPTSGFIYHIKSEDVHPINVGVEDAMRSIISCGAGSEKLITAYHNQTKEKEITAS